MKREEVEPFAEVLLKSLNKDFELAVRAVRKPIKIYGDKFYDINHGNVYFQGNKIDSILVRRDFNLLVIDGHKFYKGEQR